MASDGLMNEIVDLLRNIFEDPTLYVTSETSAKDVPGWDSMKWVMILMAVEERYAIEFSTRETDRFRNVGEMVAGVVRHLNGAD